MLFFPSQEPTSLFLGLKSSYKTTLANLGVVGSFAFVALEESVSVFPLSFVTKMILIAFPFRWAWTWLKTQKSAWHVTHGHNLESHRFKGLAVVCGKRQYPALLPALTEQHDIWLNQAPVMGCHTNIACLVLSFPGSEQSSHTASGCSLSPCPSRGSSTSPQKADVQLESFFWEHRQEQRQCGWPGRVPNAQS